MKLLPMHIKKIQSLFTKLALVLALSLTSFSVWAIKHPIDKVIAQVGDEIILLSEVQNGRLQMILNGQEGNSQTDCMILEELMVNKLLLTQARLDSIEVSEDMIDLELDDRIRYFAQQFGGIEKMEEHLDKSVAQIKAEAREQIKNRMLSQQMMMSITQNVNITPKEIREFYAGLHQDSIPYINSKVTIAHIVLYPKVTETDRQRAWDQLNGIRKEIIAGDRGFGPAAATNSMDPGSRFRGGELGWQSRGTMVPEFEAEVFRLKKDSISPIFETQYGFHIIQLMDRKGDNYLCRHILITPMVTNEALIKSAKRMDSIYAEIQKGTLTFTKAAELFSDDEESKSNGGKIVNPYTSEFQWDIQNVNDIDPQMSRILESLKIGDMSKPSLYQNFFDRKDGIRVVKLLNKTKPHLANLEQDYQLIKMAAENEKKQELLDNWINEKVRDVYIYVDQDFAKDCDFNYNWISDQVVAN